MHALSILVVGPQGSGKSTYLQRMTTGAFEESEQKEWNVRFHTSQGEVVLRCISITPEELPQYAGEPDGIVQMFDISQINQQQQAPEITSVLNGLFPGIPGVILGNKEDKIRSFKRETKTSGLLGSTLQALRKLGHIKYSGEEIKGVHFPFFDISGKTLYNQEKPWAHILKHYLGEFQWVGV